MARLRRQVGIAPVRVNLPQRTDIGSAIVKTADTFRDVVAERGADRRKQEAQTAAASLNFERDGEGNLVAPSLPISDNGLVAPNIYDRTYTQMVSQRYVQQIKIDTNERLNLIATKNRFDPSAYRELAESYVAKVTELAPDNLKADVNTAAQITMVEHFNHIIREKAERDHSEATDFHVQAIDTEYDELAGYIISGADDEILGAKRLQIRAKILEGEEFNFWDSAEAQERNAIIDRKFARDSIIADISRLAADPVTHAEAIEQLSQFALGFGKVRMVDEIGEVSMVPVTDLYPNPEDRAAIAAAGITVIQGKEAARGGFESARHTRQTKDFENWYLPHSLQRLDEGRPVDMNQLSNWFTKAVEEENHSLMNRIQKLMKEAYVNTGGSGTRVERQASAALARTMRAHQQMDDEFEARFGEGSIANLSQKQRADYEDSKWRGSGDVAIPQSAEAAEDLASLYETISGLAGENAIDFDTSPLGVIEHYIKEGPGKVGVITWNMRIPLLGMLTSKNNDQIDRALDIGRMMYNERAIRKNMETGLGNTHGRALAYIFENYSPGSIDAGTVTNLLEKFGDPNWTPHKEWEALDRDVRGKISDMTQRYLDDRFTALFPSGFEVPAIDMRIFNQQLGSIPAEMENQLFNEVRSRAGQVDPDNYDAFSRHADQAIETVVREFGWVPSRFGFSESRFAEKNPSTYAFSKDGPEAFYRDKDGNTDEFVMAELEKDFQTHLNWINREDPSLPKLTAGENAFLEFNLGQSFTAEDGRTIPAYNIHLLRADGRTELAESDRFVYGDQFAVNFELSFQTGNKKRMDVLRVEQERAAARRLEHQLRTRSGLNTFGSMK